MTLTKNNKTYKSSSLRLSIQVSLNGLSFSVLNERTNTIEFLKAISFKNKLNPNTLLDKIQSYFNSEDNLNQDFSSITVIHKNELATIVPKALFDEDHLAEYLKFNNKILSTDFISFDELELNDSVFVYVPYVNINNFLYDRFGEFTYRHFASVFVEYILKTEKHSEKTKMYVNVDERDFEVVVLSKGNLLFYNAFDYQTKEDFIYYILFTTEQLSLNPETLELVFTGSIDNKSELYDIAYKYIRFIGFASYNKDYEFIKDAQPESSHSNLVFLNSL